MHCSDLFDLEVVRRDQRSDEQDAENTETPSVDRKKDTGQPELRMMFGAATRSR